MDIHPQTPKATVIAIISKFSEGKEYVLITKRRVDPYFDKWCLPGGHIEENECAKNAIIREVKEETGLDFTPRFQKYFDEIIPSENIHAIPLIFTGSSCGMLIKENKEVSDAKWVLLKDILEYDLAFRHDEILKSYQTNRMNAFYEKEENAVLHELNYLRGEILKRFETRNWMIYFAILLAGTFLAFDKIEGFIFYPILGTILAGLWSHSDIRIADIGDYIRTQIEPKVPGLAWENHLFDVYKSAKEEDAKRQEIHVIWVFHSTYLIMIAISVFRLLPGIIEELKGGGVINSDTWQKIAMLTAGIVITSICMIITSKFIKERRLRY